MHPNAVRLQTAMAAFSRGDLDDAASIFAEDIVWHYGGSHHLAGDYRGRDEVLSFFRRVREMTADTFTVTPVDILASDRYVFVFNNLRGEREGKTLDVISVNCFKFREDGTASEYFSLVNDRAAVDAFFADR